jgi:two-component SAPR family response regulator
MPRLNGFDVIEALEPELIPAVVFTTAHDEHAIRAFEVHALDYLLKPFTEARFICVSSIRVPEGEAAPRARRRGKSWA